MIICDEMSLMLRLEPLSASVSRTGRQKVGVHCAVVDWMIRRLAVEGNRMSCSAALRSVCCHLPGPAGAGGKLRNVGLPDVSAD